MRKCEVLLHNYDELTPAAQECARDHYRSQGLDHEWWEATYDTVRTAGRLIGFDIADIYFSGFSSQGDGACCIGRYEYKVGSVAAIKKEFPTLEGLHGIALDLSQAQRKSFYKLYAEVTHTSRYYHEYSPDINVMGERQSCPSAEAQELIKESLRQFMRWAYCLLEDEYNYLTSDDEIAEALRASGYEFTAAGEVH